MLLRLPFVFLCTVSCAFAAELRPSAAAISLNPAALKFARQLISEGRIVFDQKGLWAMHHPNRAAENEFIRVHGFSEYARWHLGIDERHPENAKARYKFPFGDFENLHRCGLLAVRSRARQFGYPDIEAASAELLNDNELNRPRR